ncbi:MAG: hypothetical protein M0008_02305 [Actinomycetota bacterium]|nr:hypothetical protein [Actinomycetota bacterium]
MSWAEPVWTAPQTSGTHRDNPVVDLDREDEEYEAGLAAVERPLRLVNDDSLETAVVLVEVGEM